MIRLRTITRAAACGAASMLLCAPAALAAASAPESADKYGEDKPLNLGAVEPQTAESVSSGGNSLVRTIVGLAVVLAVIYGIAWLLRQARASKEGKAGGSGLRTLATVPLGPNRALHLVRVGDEVVLVGAAEKGVSPIRRYTEQQARAAGLLVDDEQDRTPPPGAAPAAGGAAGAAIVRMVEDLRRRTVRR